MSALHHAELVQKHLDDIVNPLLFVTGVLDRSSPWLEQVQEVTPRGHTCSCERGVWF